MLISKPLKRVKPGSTLWSKTSRVLLGILGAWNTGRLNIYSYTRGGARRARVLAVFSLLILALAGIGALGIFKPAQTAAATNGTVNFQARLEQINGAIAADGTYNVEFKLYDASSGGTLLWTEDWLNSAGHGITTVNGYLTANLGTWTSFPNTINWDQNIWLTMTVRGTGSCAFASCTPTDAEMSPRLQLTSVPYAFRAGTLATGNGTLSSVLSLIQPTIGNQTFRVLDQTAAGTYNICVQSSTTALGGCAPTTGGSGYIQNTTSVQSAANFYVRSAAIGSIGGILEGANGQTADLLRLNTFNGVTSTTVAKFDANGNLIVSATGNSSFAGSLSVGSSTAPTGGVAFFNGNVGIGTSSPVYKLDVTTGARFQGATLSVMPDATTNDKTTTNMVSNPDLENWGAGVPTSWNKAANVTISQVSGYTGSSAVRFSATTGGNVGNNRLSTTPGLAISTQYTISYYARRVSGTGALSIAIDNTGYPLVSFTDTSGNWVRVSQTITTSGTSANSISFVPATAGDTFDIDDVQVEAGASLTPFVNGSRNNGDLVVGGNFQSYGTGNNTVAGTLAIATLGSTNTSSLLCRNSSNQIAGCSTTGTGTAFVQGGNSFGAAGDLGTNDGFGLNLRTNGTTRLSLDTSGNATLTGNLTVQGAGSSSIAGTLSVGSTTAPTGGVAYFNGNVGIATSTPAYPLQVSDGVQGTSTNRIYGEFTGSTDQRGLISVRNSNNNATAANPFAGLQATAFDGSDSTNISAQFGLRSRTSSNGNGNTLISAPYNFTLFVNNKGQIGATNYGTQALNIDTSSNATLTGNLTVQGAGASSVAGTLSVGSSTAPTSAVAYFNGNVGIGLSTVTRGKLEIQQSVDTISGGIALVNSGVTGSLRLYEDASNLAHLDSGSTGANLLVLNSGGGNVSIGNTNNAFKLDVSGTGRFTGALQLDTQATATNQAVAAGRTISTGTGLTGGGDLTANRTISFAATGTGAPFVQGGNSFGAAADLGTNDGFGLNLRTNGTTRLGIDTSGNATLTGNYTVQGTGASSFAGTLSVASDTSVGGYLTVVKPDYSNLLPNGGFETVASSNYAGWGTFTGQYAIDSTTQHNGNAAVVATGNAAINDKPSTVRMPVRLGSGEKMVLEYWYKTSAGFTGTAGMWLLSYQANGTTANNDWNGCYITVAQTTWTKKVCVFDLDTWLSGKNASYVNTALSIRADMPAAQTMEWDDIKVYLTNGTSDPQYAASFIDSDNGAYFVDPSGASSGNLNGTLTVGGALTLSTLGTTNTSSLLCRNASNQIAGCSTTGAGAAFVQGGNSFGAAADLGTNDGNVLNFRTGGTTRATLSTSGDLTFAGSNVIQSASGQSLAVQSQGAGGLTLQSGSGTISLGTTTTLQANGSLTVGAGGTGNTLTLSASGNGAIVAVDTVSATTTQVLIGTTNAATVTVGNGASTTSINSGALLGIGTNGVNKTISIGQTATGAFTTTVNIATSTGAAQSVIAGSTNSGSSVTLQGGATKETISNTGDTIQTTTNSSTAFQIQNAASQPVFLVDTTNTTNLVTNPGFETGTTGWAPTGTGASITQNTATKTNLYHGQASLDVTLSGTVTSGAQITSLVGSPLAIGQYTLSFYAKGGAALAGLAASFSGGGTCTLNLTTVSAAGFQRYSCTVTTTATTSTINITSTTLSQHLYLDAVQVQAGANLTPYYIGAIQLRGVINNPVAFQATSNSTSAFQIQDSAGTSNLFIADTLNGRIGIGTNAPTQLLSVNGASTFAGNLAVTTGGITVSGASTIAGTLSSLTGLTSSGTITFSGLATNGAVTVSGGVLGSVANLGVAQGGTGAASFTTNGVLYGNNVGALGVTAAGTGGQVLLANASGVPTFTSLSGDVTVGSTGITAIGANKVVDTMLRQGGATSVIGRSANSTGNVADISASADGQVLRRIAGVLGFGTLDNSSLSSGTYSNITGVGTLGSLNVSGAITATALNAKGYITSNTSSTNSGQWTQIANCNITAQFQDCRTQAAIVSTSDGGSFDRTTLDIRVKQQNAMAGVPYISLDLAPNSVGITTSDIVAVTTQNDASATIVQVWGRINATFRTWNMAPLINTGTNQFTWLSTQGFSVSVPAGTQTTPTYGTTNTASLTVIGSSSLTGAFTNNLAAGVQHKVLATAAPTADLVSIDNSTNSVSATADQVNALQTTWWGAPSGTNVNFANRINVVNKNVGAGGTTGALRINVTGPGTSIASNTRGIQLDNLTGASSGGTEIGIDLGTGWDNLLTYNNGATVLINGTGQFNGAQLVNASVANAALANSSLTVTAGNGLSGGGSVALGGTTTLTVGAGTGITVGATTVGLSNTTVAASSYGSASSVATFTVNAQGQLTTAASTAIAIDASAITTGTLGVARGGTGAASFTTNGVLFGNNTGAIGVTAASGTGTFCLNSTNGGAPSWGACASGITLQTAYAAGVGGTTPSIAVSTTKSALSIQDSATNTITGNLLEVRSAAVNDSTLGTVQFSVTNAGVVQGNSYKIGANTVLSLPGGTTNLAVGPGAGSLISGDNDNTVVGFNAGAAITSGFNNTAIGAIALQNATGGENTAVGVQAGGTITTGTQNTFLGEFADATVNNLTNAAAIGANAQVSASNSIVLGQVATLTKIGIGVTAPLNQFSVSPTQYNTGTISQTASVTVVGSGTTFTAAMVGSQLVYQDGTSDIITAFTDTTHINVTTSRTHSSSGYRIHFIGLQVTSSGNVGIGTSSPSSLLSVGSSSQFTVSNAGVVTYAAALGNNASYVCRNGSGQLAACNTTGSGAAFVQGGNTFGAAADLGTNDGNVLNLRTNNTTRLVLDTTGNLQFQQASTISTSTGNLTLQANGASIALLDTSGAGTVTVGANATTINVGDTTNVVRTINIGNSPGNSTVNIATNTGTDAVNIGTNSTGANAIKLGGTGTTGNSNSGTTVLAQGGQTILKVATAGVAIQTFTNSTTALQVSDVSNNPILAVDTTTYVQNGVNVSNLLTNPSFEGPTSAGWAATGTGAVINGFISPGLYGTRALQFTTGSVSGTGVQVTGITGAPIAIGTYTFSFYANGGSVASGLAVSFSGGGTCTLNSIVTTSSWQRYYCTVTTTATTSSVNITSTSTSTAINIDGVMLMKSSFAAPFVTGSISLTGAIIQPVTIMNTSPNAFQIQSDFGNSNLFVADTVNGRIGIGTSTPTVSLQVQGTSGVLVQSGTDTATKLLDLNTGTGHGGTQFTIGGTINNESTLSVNVYRAGTYTPRLQVLSDGNMVLQGSSAGSVGIGTTGTPNATLEVSATSTPTIRVSTGSSTSFYTMLQDTGQNQATLNKVGSLGNVLIDINPQTNDGTSATNVRLFRSTNTVGAVALQIYKGDNTATLNTSLAGNGDGYINANTGFVGIGTSGPAAKLDVQSTTTAGTVFNVAALTLTTGKAATISSSSASMTSANILQLTANPTYSSATTVSGNVLQINRSITNSIANTGVQNSPTLDSNSLNTTAGTVQTTAMTIGANADRYIVVFITVTNGAGAPTSVNYTDSGGTGISLSQASGSPYTAGAAYDEYVYLGKAPPVGNGTLQINYGVAPTVEATQAMSWYGVAQTTPQGGKTVTGATSASTSSSVTQSSTTTGVVIEAVGTIGVPGLAATPGAGQTVMLAPNLASKFGSSYKTAAATSTTMTWSNLPSASWDEVSIYLTGSYQTGTTINGSALLVQNSCSTTTDTSCITTGPAADIVQSDVNATGSALLVNNLGRGNALEVRNSNRTDFLVNASGNVGIGTSSPAYPLDVSGTVHSTTGFTVDNGVWYQSLNSTGGIGSIMRLGTDNQTYINIISAGTKFYVQSTASTNVASISQTGAARFLSTVTPSVTPDYSETIYASDDSAALDVVMADPNNTERIVKAVGAYNPTAIGIVSEGKGGVIINHPEYYGANPGIDSDYLGLPVTVAGRVPVHVTTENGVIKPGDHLTTSATRPGYAMKATKAGPTIGISYGFYDGTDTGHGASVLTLVNIGYYDPNDGNNIQADNVTVNTMTVNGAMDAQSINTGSLKASSLEVTGNAIIGGDLDVSGDLTVTGATVVNDITVNGHIITGGETPDIQILSAAGSSNASVSVDGNDTSGTITLVTGDASKPASGGNPPVVGPVAGDMATITFKKPYGKTPRILLTPADGKSAPLLVYPTSMSATSFTISLTHVPEANTSYSFEYFIVQ